MQRGFFKKSKNNEYAVGKLYLDIYNYNVHEAVVDFFRKISTDEEAQAYLKLILKDLDKHYRSEAVRFLLDYQSLKDWPLKNTWVEFYNQYVIGKSKGNQLLVASLNLTDVESKMFKQLNKKMQDFFDQGSDTRHAFHAVIIDNLGLIGTTTKQYTAANFIEKMIDKMLGMLAYDFAEIQEIIKQRMKELDAKQYEKDFEKPKMKAKKAMDKLERKGKGKGKEKESSVQAVSSSPKKLQEVKLDEDFFMFESISSSKEKAKESKERSSSEEKKSPKR